MRVNGTLIHEGVTPIKIRDNCTVLVAHIPHDLTKREADKIMNVIMAMTDQPPAQAEGE